MFFKFIFGCSLLCAAQLNAFILPVHTILENNASSKTGLRNAVLVHDIQFLEGFYSPLTFSCKENIYYQAPKSLRVDISCGNVVMVLLSSEKNRKLVYNKIVNDQEVHPLHYLLSLFLSSDLNVLLPSLHQAQFIEATEKIEADLKTWEVQSTVSLTRLGRIEKSIPTKLEKNLAYLIQGDHKLWLEKDLYLPQKIEYQGQILLFQKYKDLGTIGPKNSFKYPELIQITEEDIPGVTLQSQYGSILLNTKLNSNVFQSSTALKRAATAFGDDDAPKKEVLEKFISQYR